MIMKKLLLLLLPLLSVSAFAGSLGLVCPVTNIRPPANLTCSVVSAGPHALPPVGFQWNLSTSQATGAVTVAAAGTAVTAQKNASSNGAGLMLLNGVNGNVIADGTIAVVIIPVPATVTCSGGSACFIITLSSPLGTSTNPAKAIAEIANPPVSVSVSNACDINGDGRVNIEDVMAEHNKVIAVPQQIGDLNADGRTDLVDEQIVIDASRGLACTAL